MAASLIRLYFMNSCSQPMVYFICRSYSTASYLVALPIAGYRDLSVSYVLVLQIGSRNYTQHQHIYAFHGLRESSAPTHGKPSGWGLPCHAVWLVCDLPNRTPEYNIQEISNCTLYPSYETIDCYRRSGCCLTNSITLNPHIQSVGTMCLQIRKP